MRIPPAQDARAREFLARLAGSTESIRKKIEDFAAIAVPPQRGRPEPAPWQHDRQAQVEAYKGSVNIAIGAIARRVATQEAEVYVRKQGKAGGEERLNNHALLDLFDYVNDLHTQYDLWFHTVGFRISTGDAYLWKVRNGFKVPAELWVLPSPWVHAIPSRDKFIEKYRVKGFFEKDTDIDASEIVRISEPNMDWRGSGRYYGYSQTQSAASVIDTEEQLWKRLNHQFRNFSPPGLTFESTDDDAEFDASEYSQIFGFVSSLHSLAEHTGNPLLVPPGFRASNAGVHSPREMDYGKSLDMMLERTLAQYGVPKAVVGLVTDVNRANMLGAMEAFCHDSETECLTAAGWKRYDELTSDTRIACYDKDTDKLVYRKPSNIIVKNYKGKMCRWKGRCLDALMSPEHRCLVQTFEKPHEHQRGHRRDWAVRRAGELARTTTYRIMQAAPAACDPPQPQTLGMPDTLSPEDFLEFIGWFVSEGCLTTSNRIALYQLPGENADRIRGLLERVGFSYTETSHPDSGVLQFTMRNKRLWAWLESHCGRGCENKKLPDFIKSWPAESLAIVLDAAIRGDGTSWRQSTKGRVSVYSTSSSQLADDIQEVAVKCGYRASLNRKEAKPSGNVKTRKPWKYTVCIYSERVRTVKQTQRFTEDYDGVIWCVTVPTGFFVVRRNGAVHVTGNCENTVNPLLVHMGQHLTQGLARDFDERLIVRFPPCTVDDAEQMRKNMDTATRAGAVTVDEVREVLTDFGKLPEGGDKRIIGNGFSFVDDMGKPEPTEPDANRKGASDLPPDEPTNGKLNGKVQKRQYEVVTLDEVDELIDKAVTGPEVPSLRPFRPGRNGTPTR